MNKVVLTKTQRAELVAIRARLEAGLGRLRRASHDRSGLEAEQGKLEREIARLERADITDGTAGRLAVKQEKLRMITRRIEADNNPTGADADALRRTLAEFQPLFRAIFRQVYDSKASKVLAVLRRFYHASFVSDQLAAQTHLLQECGAFLNTRWGLGSGGGPINQAKSAIAIIDNFIAGRNPWKFTP